MCSLVIVCCALGCDGPAARSANVDASADVSAPPPGDAPASRLEPSFAPTFSAIYSEVFAQHGCLLGLCHGEGASGGGLNLVPRAGAHGNLLAPSTSRECGSQGLAVVEPGSPTESLLQVKLEPEVPCGLVMPPDGPIDRRHLEQVRQWIERGAPDD